MPIQHTDREFEEELDSIREQIIEMGRLVETMLADGMRAFEHLDVELSRRVIASDSTVDRLEIDIDEMCRRVLARRQPMGSDLRFVTTAMKVITDIERIGDLCVNIAERTMELAQESGTEPFEDLSVMAHDVGLMLSQAIGAFVGSDTNAATSIIEADRAVDARYSQAFRQLLKRMLEDPANVSRATRFQAVAKYLERIGDHTTNLAEMIVFMVRGRDIRHEQSQARSGFAKPHGVLFLCVHNAARSQMAEGWARQLLPSGTEIWSAGSDPSDKIDPRAVTVMNEVGIDISLQCPKRISDVPLRCIDTVIALCSEEICVTLPGIAFREIWAFPDPSCQPSVTSDESLLAFRDIRDELKTKIMRLAETLNSHVDAAAQP
jgi:phosphate transport system protein